MGGGVGWGGQVWYGVVPLGHVPLSSSVCDVVWCVRWCCPYVPLTSSVVVVLCCCVDVLCWVGWWGECVCIRGPPRPPSGATSPSPQLVVGWGVCCPPTSSGGVVGCTSPLGQCGVVYAALTGPPTPMSLPTTWTTRSAWPPLYGSC